MSYEPVRVQAGPVSLQAYDYGNAGATPMVIVHGIQDFALAFSDIAEAFAETHHVVSFDLRGHGDSDKPGIYTMPHFMADLHAVLEHFRFERAVLVGHSLGSQIVTQYASIFTEVPSMVISIDGIGAPMRESDMPVEDRQWRFRNGILSLLQPGGEKRPMHDLDDAASLYCRFHPGLDYDLSRKLVELGTEEHPHGGLKWKWDPQVLTIGMLNDRQAAEERWTWIECPTLIITGGKSVEFFIQRRGLDPDLARSAPEEIPRRIGLFRNAVHVEIPEAGHMIHLHTPEKLIEAIRSRL